MKSRYYRAEKKVKLEDIGTIIRIRFLMVDDSRGTAWLEGYTMSQITEAEFQTGQQYNSPWRWVDDSFIMSNEPR